MAHQSPWGRGKGASLDAHLPAYARVYDEPVMPQVAGGLPACYRGWYRSRGDVDRVRARPPADQSPALGHGAIDVLQPGLPRRTGQGSRRGERRHDPVLQQQPLRGTGTHEWSLSAGALTFVEASGSNDPCGGRRVFLQFGT